MTEKIRKQINFALPRNDDSFLADLAIICRQTRLPKAAAIRAAVQHYARAVRVAQATTTQAPAKPGRG